MQFNFSSNRPPPPRPMTTGTPGRYGARPLTAKETRVVVLFLVLFGMPFAAAGVWALVTAFAKGGAGDLQSAIFLVPVGLLFSLVGFGLIAGSLYGRRRLTADAELALAHPDEPWKWRPDWAQGHVLDGARNQAYGVLYFAVLWNLIAFPGGLTAWNQAVRQGQPWAPIALLFPAAGIALAAGAARGFIRMRRFGGSRLNLATVPVPVGRTLAGSVRTSLTNPPEGGFLLTLSAIRNERSSSGGDSSDWTRVVWQEEAQVEGQLSSDERGVHVVVPVAIRIPAEAPSTDHSNSYDTVLWRLEVAAARPHVDFKAAFEVPVYRTSDSAQPETARDAAHLRAVGPIPPGGMRATGDPIPATYAVPDAPALAGAPRPEPRSMIAVSRDADGLTVDFPAARNPSAAAGLAGFWLMWTLAIGLMIKVGAPWFFPILFGLFDLLIGYFALVLCCEVIRVRVGPGGVSIASGFGAPGAERTIPVSEIADIRVAIGMQVNTTAYFDLKLARGDGRMVSAGSSIRHKREAEWIAAQMKDALGLVDRSRRA